MSEVNLTKYAMKSLNHAMNDDEGPGSYRDGWKANIAMTIHDAFNAEPVNIGTEEEPSWIGKRLNPSSVEDCEEIAERFLRLAFPKNDT